MHYEYNEQVTNSDIPKTAIRFYIAFVVEKLLRDLYLRHTTWIP